MGTKHGPLFILIKNRLSIRYRIYILLPVM